MDVEDVGANIGKSILRPRKPGENLKEAVTVLKRRDRNLKHAAERAAKIAKKKKQAARSVKLNIVRAESIVKKFRVNLSDKRRLKRVRKQKKLKDPKKAMVPKGKKRAEVLAVVRNARLGGSKEVKRALRELRLKETNTLVFLLNTKESLERLRVVDPFVFYGPPSYKLVNDLLFKRAKFKPPQSSEKILLNDNGLVEQHMGPIGMLCIEDLVQAIFTGSEDFQATAERLWPFELGDVRKSGAGLTPEKDHLYGNLKEGITAKVTELLG